MYHITGDYGLLILLALLGVAGIFGTYGNLNNFLSSGDKSSLFWIPVCWFPFSGYLLVLIRSGYFEHVFG